MENKWTIRPAQSGEAATVLAMIKALADYEKLAHDVTATEADIEQTLLQQESPARCFLGFVGDLPAGFAVFFHNYSTFQGRYGVYLEDIFVLPEFRGLGLGRGLLEAVIEYAKGHHCGRVEWSVLDWNKPAMLFYQKLGAKAYPEWVRFRMNLL